MGIGSVDLKELLCGPLPYAVRILGNGGQILLLIHLCKYAITHDDLAVHCRQRHLGTSGAVDQVGDHVAHGIGIHRQHRGAVQVNRDKVRLLARLQRAYAVPQADSLGSLDGGHPQGPPGGHDLRIAVLDLVEQGHVFHLVDDIVTVVARSLVGAQSHTAARLLEGHARTDDAVNDADGARVDDHGGALASDVGGLLVGAVGEVDGNQGGVQITQLIQKRGGPLSVALFDLIGLPVALLNVHMDFSPAFFDDFLNLQEHFRTDKIRSLGPEQNLDPAPRLVVPLVVELDVALEALLTHLVVELIELARLVNPPFGGSDGLGNIASGPHLFDEAAHIIHL